MIKTLGILAGGIFVGAVGVEIVRRKCPEAFAKLSTRVRKMAAEARDAFKSGYENAMRSEPEQPAEASA